MSNARAARLDQRPNLIAAARQAAPTPGCRRASPSQADGFCPSLLPTPGHRGLTAGQRGVSAGQRSLAIECAPLCGPSRAGPDQRLATRRLRPGLLDQCSTGGEAERLTAEGGCSRGPSRAGPDQRLAWRLARCDGPAARPVFDRRGLPAAGVRGRWIVCVGGPQWKGRARHRSAV
jgi:hypothetical protein